MQKDRSTVLTGATGFLGAFLMEGLLKQGHHLTVLGRPSNGISLSERLSVLTRWLGIDPGNRLLPIEVDFSKEYMGLNSDTYSSLCNHTGKVIHCASDTSFSHRNRSRVINTNVSSLSALLKYVLDTGAEKFFYISSAYASGVCEGKCTENPITNNMFTNVYEESKAKAENIIIDAFKNAVPYCILRPSIVFGHSETGISLRFNALYYVIKSLLVIRDIFMKDIMEHGGERSKKWGFNLDDGILYMPIDIYLPKRGSINLIPIDYFVNSTLMIIENFNSNGIYHITNDNPLEITTLIEYTEKLLRIRGIKLLLNKTTVKDNTNPAEELFEKFIAQYKPYLSDTRIFDRSRFNDITRGLTVPAFTYAVFSRCMNYALEKNWGKIGGFPC